MHLGASLNSIKGQPLHCINLDTATDPSGYSGTLVDYEVGTAGEAILDAAYLMASNSAVKIGMSIIADLVIVADVVLINYIIADYLLNSICSIADGSIDSSEVNKQIEDNVTQNDSRGGNSPQDPKNNKLKEIAQKIAEKFNGVISNTKKDNGYMVRIKIRSRDLIIRETLI